eukprot:gene17936-biopygen2984
MRTRHDVGRNRSECGDQMASDRTADTTLQECGVRGIPGIQRGQTEHTGGCSRQAPCRSIVKCTTRCVLLVKHSLAPKPQPASAAEMNAKGRGGVTLSVCGGEGYGSLWRPGRHAPPAPAPSLSDAQGRRPAAPASDSPSA